MIMSLFIIFPCIGYVIKLLPCVVMEVGLGDND